MKLEKLYSRASTGALREWVVEYEEGRFRTHSGQIDGKITTSKWYDVKPMNVGRSNERGLLEQAKFQAEAKWKKKVEAGYVTEVDKVDTVLFVKPMLAKKWEDRKDKIEYPVYTQPKLDGMRAIITKDGAKSRNGKPWVTIPHILKSLEPVFKAYPNLVLDGELYNHEYKDDFNTISSLAKKTKPTEQDLKDSADKLQFWWYDIIPVDGFCEEDIIFSDRFKEMININNEYKLNGIILVPTYCYDSEEELDKNYKYFIELGYEGGMIRLNSKYDRKRSNSLLKRKDFTDSEYKIVSIEEGKGNKSGMAGYMVLQKDDGVQFHSNIKGNHDFLKNLLVDAESYVGSYATCTYFNLTPDGIPRFPFVTRFRDGIGVD